MPELLPAGSEETVQLAVLDGLEMTYLARHDGRQPVRLASQIGRRLPATRHRDGQGGAGLARRARARSAARRRDVAAADDAELDQDGRRRSGPISRWSASAATRWTTRRQSKAWSASASAIPARRPGEGPYAASITLLKARATGDRVAALVDDLQLLGRACCPTRCGSAHDQPRGDRRRPRSRRRPPHLVVAVRPASVARAASNTC